ncbi:MAG: hypothetical protein H6744_00445 [Deltaproteobacteria bacterium]|nr:hypothetical protein [Deltaproteobacteria bacterium]MCB9785134.1 hypothetical protein [Deltaproteobacteria bacterium]
MNEEVVASPRHRGGSGRRLLTCLLVAGSCWSGPAFGASDVAVAGECAEARLGPEQHGLLRSAARAAAADVGAVALRGVAIDGALAELSFEAERRDGEASDLAAPAETIRYRLEPGSGSSPWRLERLAPCPGPAGSPATCAGPELQALDDHLIARLRERGTALRWTCAPPEAAPAFHPPPPPEPEPEPAATAATAEPPRPRRALPETEHSADRLGLAGLFALLLIVAPLLLGWIFGRLASRAPGTRRRAPRALAWLLPILLACVLFRLRPFGLWEAALAGVFCALGLRSGLASVRWRQLPRAVARWALPLLVTALLLELAVRLLLPTPPDVGGLYRSALFGPIRGWQCKAIHGEVPDQSPGGADPTPTIMHVGDSMVAGAFVDRSVTFVSVLDQHARAAPGGPRVNHLSAAASGASLDTEVLLALRVLDAVETPRLVVLYFNENDFHEIDEPVACCDSGPLFAYEDGLARPRCAAASFGFSPGGKAELSRPPVVLRLLAQWSAAAAYLSNLLVVIPAAVRIWPMQATIERGANHYAMVLRYFRDALHARGVDLVVVLLPHRKAIGEHPDDSVLFPAETIRKNYERAAAIVKSLDIPSLDAWPYFDALVRAQGYGTWFVDDPPGDVHFNARGHAALAEWLEASLAPWLR